MNLQVKEQDVPSVVSKTSEEASDGISKLNEAFEGTLRQYQSETPNLSNIATRRISSVLDQKEPPLAWQPEGNGNSSQYAPVERLGRVRRQLRRLHEVRGALGETRIAALRPLFKDSSIQSTLVSLVECSQSEIGTRLEGGTLAITPRYDIQSERAVLLLALEFLDPENGVSREQIFKYLFSSYSGAESIETKEKAFRVAASVNQAFVYPISCALATCSPEHFTSTERTLIEGLYEALFPHGNVASSGVVLNNLGKFLGEEYTERVRKRRNQINPRYNS